jgi:nicotinamide-nucleotide amidase
VKSRTPREKTLSRPTPISNVRAHAEILCVGSELLAGKVNTHVAHIAPRLRDVGLQVLRTATLDDDKRVIRDAVTAALQRSQVVILSGGLGPTFDDLTREGVAAAVDAELRYQPALFRGIQRKYQRFGLKTPPSNKRQAWVIDGARVLENPNGSAPGQYLQLKNPTRHIFLLPGPFSELEPMFRTQVLPRLQRRFGAQLKTARRVFRIFGLAEAAVNDRLKPLLKKHSDCDFTILAQLGRVSLHVAAHRKSATAAVAQLNRLQKLIARSMGRHFIGIDEDSLETLIGKALVKRKWTLGTAESCTGGLVAQRLTAVPGSSKYFHGAIVSYANSVKEKQLGIAPQTLKKHGAVSAQTAQEMAAGARRALDVDCAIALTGVAGPSGGSAKKPRGLVHIALALPHRTFKKSFIFHGNRQQVRERATHTALYLLLRRLC